MAPSPIPMPLVVKMPGPDGLMVMVPENVVDPLFTVMVAVPAATVEGTIKLICPGEAKASIAAVPLMDTEQEPRVVGSLPGAIQVAIEVTAHKFWPKTVAKEPGAIR
jgi:hypothetical protein